MNTKEFRIGNILREKNSGELIQVVELNEETIIFSGSFDGDWQAEPIPLSEEVLLKVGFELKSQWFDYEKDGFRLGYISDDVNFQIETSTGKVIDVKTLHHLQNLYFFNSGQELNTSGLI